MHPNIRVALTADGDIEAGVPFNVRQPRVVIDRRTGDLITSTVDETNPLYRWLLRAAREHVSKPDRREMT